MESFRGWNGMTFRIFTDPFTKSLSINYFDHVDDKERDVWYVLGGKEKNKGMTLHSSLLYGYPTIETSAKSAIKFNKITGAI